MQHFICSVITNFCSSRCCHALLIIFVFSFLSFGVNLRAQTKLIDSLNIEISKEQNQVAKALLLIQLGPEFRRIDVNKYQSAIDSASAIVEFMSDNGNDLLIQYHYADIDFARNKFEEAKEKFYAILKDAPSDSSLIAKTNYKLGSLLRVEGNYVKATEHLLLSKEIDQKLGHRLHEASVDIVLGIIHKKLNQYPKALEFYKSAYLVYKEFGEKENMSTAILNMANVYTKQDSLDKALETYNVALEIGKESEGNDDLLAYIYNNISSLETQQGNFKAALSNSQKSFALRENKASPREKINSYVGIAANQMALNRYSESLNTVSKALNMAEGVDAVVEQLEKLYDIKYKLHKKRNEDALSIQALEKYFIYYDSLRNTELDKQAIELNKKYETTKKEIEIDLLKVQRANDANLMAIQRSRTIGLALGLAIFGLLLFWVYKLYQKSKVQNETIQRALEEKDVLLREIHHRVKNNLQFISSLLGLQSDYIEDKNALNALQEGQDRVQSMALIHQNLYQDDNLTGVEVDQYFEKLIQNLFDSYNIRPDKVNLMMEIEPLNLDVDTIIPIGLIVNELVSNSLKYAFPNNRNGTIHVSLNEKDNALKLKVQDDGIGMEATTIEDLGTSFGFRLVEVFKDQLKAQLSIDGTNGTTVEMSIEKYSKGKTI